MAFSRDNVVTLIEMYKDFPCLWNTKLQEYKNRNSRDDAYRKISDSLPNYTVDSIKSKIQTLRRQYRTENMAMKKTKKSGSGSDDVYKPKLWCYDLLNFLKDDIICETTSSLSQPCSSQSELVNTANEGDESQDTESAIVPTPSPTLSQPPEPFPVSVSTSKPSSPTRSEASSPAVSSRPPTPVPQPGTSSSEYLPCQNQPRCKKKKTEDSDPLYMAALKRLAQPSRNKDQQDDRFKAYGTSFAADLRELNKANPLACILAKKLMDEIIMKAYLGELNKNTKIVNVASVSIDEWNANN